MRRWLLLILVALSPALALAQAGTTAITAQVQDANGDLYVNCQWSVVFVGQNTTPGAGPYAPASLLNGQQGTCDSQGNILGLSLADNINTVTPTPSQWSFSICSASGYVGGPYCKANILITITGASQSITSTLAAVLPVLPQTGSINLASPPQIGNVTPNKVFSTGGAFNGTYTGAMTLNGTLNGITPQGYLTNARPPLAGWMFSRNEAFTQFPINVVILGDSQTICYNALVSCGTGPTVDINRWAEQLRIQLQAQYGSHGTGMVPLVSNVGNANVNAQYWTLSGGTTTSSIIGPTQTNPQQSGSSLVALSNGEIATFHSTMENSESVIQFDGFNVYCATNASSGSIAVAVDSVSKGTACGSTTGSVTAHVVTFASLGLSNHSITLTCTGTCYLYAGEGTAGSSGISVHNLATASAAAEYFGSTPATQLAFSDLIPSGTQLVILDLGTNDVNTLYGYSVTSYTNAIQAILTHEATLNAPSVLIMQPPVSNVTGGGTNWPIYTAALLGLVQSNLTAYVNIQSRWGTTFNSTYFCSDHVHPCDFGSLDEFSMVSQALIDPTPTLPFTVSAQGFNAISNGNNPGNPFFNASCAPTAVDCGVSWTATGANSYQQAIWSTGNSGGISGVLGLIDQTTQTFPWNTNSTDDMCFGTPESGGNIANCTGAGLHYANSTATTTVAHLAIGGTTASLSGTGACATITTQSGGSQAGKAKCTGTTGASTLVITPGTTAANGWTCYVQDETTRANLFQQTSDSTTACTLTITSVTSNDVFTFWAVSF